MKQPLQALLIAPDEGMRAAIINGRKVATVRNGLREYEIGPVMLCCHLVPWAVMADVIEVTHTVLANLTQEQVEADGYDSAELLLASLRKFYPDVQLDSPITFVRWTNVRGALIDRANQTAK